MSSDSTLKTVRFIRAAAVRGGVDRQVHASNCTAAHFLKTMAELRLDGLTHETAEGWRPTDAGYLAMLTPAARSTLMRWPDPSAQLPVKFNADPKISGPISQIARGVATGLARWRIVTIKRVRGRQVATLTAMGLAVATEATARANRV